MSPTGHTSGPETPPIPAAIVVTPFVTLRPFHPSDAPALARLANNPHVAYNLTSTFPQRYTLADALEWCSRASAASPPLNFAIIETPTSSLCGSIGFERAPHPDKRRALTIGYWLGEPFWGKGMMAAAARALVGWAFETWDAGDDKLERVEGCAYSRNRASQRVLEKVGFVYEGRRRKAETKEGEMLDVLVYGLLREDWERVSGESAVPGG